MDSGCSTRRWYESARTHRPTRVTHSKCWPRRTCTLHGPTRPITPPCSAPLWTGEKHPELARQADAARGEVVGAVRDAQRRAGLGSSDPERIAEVMWALTFGIARLGTALRRRSPRGPRCQMGVRRVSDTRLTPICGSAEITHYRLVLRLREVDVDLRRLNLHGDGLVMHLPGGARHRDIACSDGNGVTR